MRPGVVLVAVLLALGFDLQGQLSGGTQNQHTWAVTLGFRSAGSNQGLIRKGIFKIRCVNGRLNMLNTIFQSIVFDMLLLPPFDFTDVHIITIYVDCIAIVMNHIAESRLSGTFQSNLFFDLETPIPKKRQLPESHPGLTQAARPYE